MPMILYKFKAPEPLLHLLDIIVNQRLFCQEYWLLNDPFEGQFEAMIESSPASDCDPHSASEGTSFDVGALGGRDLRVCSLTTQFNDVRMWSHYGGGLKGFAIEIDFTDCSSRPLEVLYEPKLRRWSGLGLKGLGPRKVLCSKTYHWSYESEFRIIQSNPYVDVHSRILRILVGPRAESDLVRLISRIAPPDIQLVQTALDADGVCVRIGQSIPRDC